MRLRRSFVLLCFLFGWIQGRAAEWQWSVPLEQGRAFLWIPPDCQQVRALVFAQHNMSEESILEHPLVRETLGRLGIAEVWVAPPTEMIFDFNQGAGERFEKLMRALAAESGYGELTLAPAIPLGHSACATFPWNFGAWNPARTLAIISEHGDAPQTNMTGYGRANINWGSHTIDGVPGLMVMGEYEWGEDRLAPALDYRAKHPGVPIAMLPEPGRGHFDVSDDLVRFLCLFIRKAAEYRLPASAVLDQPSQLKPVDPAKGWLVERWRLNQPREVPPAPINLYTGNPSEAFWCFDEEMALATQNYRANQIGKRPQLLGWVQDGQVLPQSATHNQVSLRFEPLADGITFKFGAAFLDSVDGGSPNTTRWTGLPAGSPIGHATGRGPIILSRITGPVVQVASDTFRVQFNRASSTTDRRNQDIWLLASHPGDATHKSAVQQALMTVTPNADGAAQTIAFPAIPDQRVGTESVALTAISDAGVPVNYYVREGPAFVGEAGKVLRFTPLPPRAKFPVKVTVVAWQWGRASAPKLQTAAPVEQTFLITP